MARREFIRSAAVASAALCAGASIADDDVAEWPMDPDHQRLVDQADASVAAAARRCAADPLRPAFHFTPAARFMNDPNGCVRFGGAYHIFYQHLPYFGEPGAPWIPGWGHAVSRDLVNWEHWPIALMPRPGTYDAAAVASGACVVGDDGRPTIIYTSVPPQAQSLARSFDGGRTFRRSVRNPVLPGPPSLPGIEDGFRDPCVWREGGTWRMLVGAGVRHVGGAVLLYESPDLLAWRVLGTMCTGMGPDCFQWECPAFFPLGSKWVLIVSPLLHSEPALRGPVQYAVGDYDGRTFQHSGFRVLDCGGPACFYAPNTLTDGRGRRILFGWLMGGGSPGAPWDGLLTLPRHLRLGTDHSLRTSPAREVDALRTERIASYGPRAMAPDRPLEPATGNQLDLIVEMQHASTGRLEIRLLESSDHARGLTVHWDPERCTLRSGQQTGELARGLRAPRTLRILIDRSVVEIYADSRTVMSLRYNPQPGDDGLRIIAPDGAALRSLQAWRMGAQTGQAPPP